MAGATDVARIVVGLFGDCGCLDESHQAELFLQVEVLMGNDALMVFSGISVKSRSEYMAGVSGFLRCRISSPSSNSAVIILSSSTKNVGAVTTMSFISFV